MSAQTSRMMQATVVARIRPVQPAEKDSYVTRFDVHQRIQHILMITSFLTLAFTGLPQKTHMVGASQWWIALLGGLEMVQMIHRIAAGVMFFDGFYHVVYLMHGILVGKKMQPLHMIPMPKDVKDFLQMALYFCGLREERPKFGRFSYLEKFDYFAIFWGIPIIGGSGLILAFPVLASKVFGGAIVPIALTAHSDEALLAVAWIFIVHFFYVHLAPTVFPFNSSIFTGKVPLHRYKEEHPLDYERMQLLAERKRRAEEEAQELAERAARSTPATLSTAQVVIAPVTITTPIQNLVATIPRQEAGTSDESHVNKSLEDKASAEEKPGAPGQ